jgi:YHS domain-containing protein
VIRLILIAILLLLIARAFWRLVDGIIEAAGGKTRRRGAGRPPAAPAVKLVRDPVCGTHLPPASAVTLAVGGTTHYFCSAVCRDRFRKSA